MENKWVQVIGYEREEEKREDSVAIKKSHGTEHYEDDSALSSHCINVTVCKSWLRYCSIAYKMLPSRGTGRRGVKSFCVSLTTAYEFVILSNKNFKQKTKTKRRNFQLGFNTMLLDKHQKIVFPFWNAFQSKHNVHQRWNSSSLVNLSQNECMYPSRRLESRTSTSPKALQKAIYLCWTFLLTLSQQRPLENRIAACWFKP